MGSDYSVARSIRSKGRRAISALGIGYGGYRTRGVDGTVWYRRLIRSVGFAGGSEGGF